MKIGLLNACACPAGADDFRQGYGAMFQRFFAEHLPAGFSLHEYRVTQRYWPNALHECDGWIIGASQHSVHDKNSWIMKLMEFACACHFNQRPLVGLGFGHQVIACAFGGEVSRRPGGWNLGLRRCRIQQPPPWMEPVPEDGCVLAFSHREQVAMLPGEARRLAGEAGCRHAVYLLGEHLFAIQGHPEYDRPFLRAWLDENRAHLTEAQYRQALASLEQPLDPGTAGRWMGRFFASRAGAASSGR